MTKSRYSLVLNSARLSTFASILEISASTAAIAVSSAVVSTSASASTAFFFFSVSAYNLSTAYESA
jgi:hypothetical protein